MTVSTYTTEREAHGHRLRFDGGEGYPGIDVAYDGRTADYIGTFIHAEDLSTQNSREEFEAHVAEYLADLSEEAAHLHANGGRASSR